MKRQHKQPEVQPSPAIGDGLPDLAGQQALAAVGLAIGNASTPMVTLAAPEGSVWWDEEEPVARTGGVCLLVA